MWTLIQARVMPTTAKVNINNLNKNKMETPLEFFEATIDAYNSEVMPFYKYSFNTAATETFTEMLIEYSKKYNEEKNKELLEILNQKFDDYHNKQLGIDNDKDPEYYLFMEKANAIGEIIDLINILEENEI